MLPTSLSKPQGSQVVPIFKVLADKGTHPPVRLDRAVCVVGRQGSATLSLPAKQVSKVHAMVVRDQQGVYLRDLASTNGVELNGTPIREAGLRDKDVIRIGAYTFRCETGFGGVGGGVGGDGAARRDGGGNNGTGAATPRAPAPPAELRWKDQSFAFPRDRHTLLIGRREGCDVQLDDPSVAPVHAILFELEGMRQVYAFVPEKTKLNGGPAHHQELAAGDELRIGDVALSYVITESAAPDASAAADGDAAGVAVAAAAPDDSLAPLGVEAPADGHAIVGDLEIEAEDEAPEVELVEVEEAPAAVSDEPAVVSVEAPPASVEPADDIDALLEVEPLNPPPLEASGTASMDESSQPADEAMLEAEGDAAPAQPAPALAEPASDVIVAMEVQTQPAIAPASRPARAETTSSSRSAPATTARGNDRGDASAASGVGADDDLSDIVPFDLGPVEPELEPEPLVDPALEERLSASLEFDLSAEQGEEDAVLAELAMPREPSASAELANTFDEDDLSDLAMPAAKGDDLSATLDEADDVAALEASPADAASAGAAGAAGGAPERDGDGANVDVIAEADGLASGQAGPAAAAGGIVEAEASLPVEVIEPTPPAAVALPEPRQAPLSRAKAKKKKKSSESAPAEASIREPDPQASDGDDAADAEPQAVRAPADQAAQLAELVKNADLLDGTPPDGPAEKASAAQAAAESESSQPPTIASAPSARLERPTMQQITSMLEEVVEKVRLLQEAWAAYQADQPPAGSPGPSAGPFESAPAHPGQGGEAAG